MAGATCETLQRLDRCPADKHIDKLEAEIIKLRQENERLSKLAIYSSIEGTSSYYKDVVEQRGGVLISLEQLKEIEWCGPCRHCPVCDRPTGCGEDQGHQPNCWLDAKIRAAKRRRNERSD